jgi:threonine dehydrogenase-like Zn-dependent dehydrogenase
MKAAVYYGPGKIVVQNVADPVCMPEGAIVKVAACGVCNVMDVDAWTRWPIGASGSGFARGHEWSGEIVEVGSKMKDFKVGDRIFQNPVFRPCYKCHYCVERDYWRCVNWRDGLAQRSIHGGFAEYVSIPFMSNESAAKMPDSMDWIDLSLVEPIYLGIGLANKVREGETVLVAGLELMGLATIAKLKEKNIKVITCDVSKNRRKAAEDLGADLVIDSIEEDVVRSVMKETKGHGADIVILIDTRPAGLFHAMGSVRRAGSVWLAGYYYSPFKVNANIGPSEGDLTKWIGPGISYSDPSVGFDPGLLHMQNAWGSLGARVPRWHQAVEMIKAGKITAKKHVTKVFPLEKTAEAFDLTKESYEEIKIVVKM